jgi:glutathione S-transferase
MTNPATVTGIIPVCVWPAGGKPLSLMDSGAILLYLAESMSLKIQP